MSTTRVYAKFLGLTLSGIVLFVAYVWLQSWILSDRTMGFQHQMVRYQKELLRGDYPHLEGLDVLVIGDSTAAQNILPPNLVDLRSASTAASGISAIESYYILKRYLDTPTVEARVAPQCVVLMTSYGAHGYHVSNFFWPLIIGHGLITSEEAFDLYRESEKIRAWPSTDFQSGSFLWNIFRESLDYHLQFGTLNQIVFRPGLTFLHPQRSYRTFRRMSGAGPLTRRPIWLEQSFDGPNQEFFKKPFVPDPILDLYIAKIVELTRQRGIRLVVAYGPLAESIRTPASEAWLADAIAHLTRLTESNPHVVNLLKAHWMIDSYFTDASHLKWSSAIAFSQNLARDLQFCREPEGN